MTLKQHIVVDVSDETFVTEPYSLDITGGIDISGLGRTIIRTDGTTEITDSIKLKNVSDNTIKITPNEIDISGIGNINMDTLGNVVFSCNNGNNNNTVTISSETIIIDTSDNTGLHIKKQPRPDANSSTGLSNNGDIVISDHGNCSGVGDIAGIIQFEASPFNHDDSDNSQFVDKCGQIALTHEGIVDNDTWGLTFNLLGDNNTTTNTYELLKLSGKNMVGVCGKDPERNLDVSGSFRVTNGDIEASGNLYLDEKVGIGKHPREKLDVNGNVRIFGAGTPRHLDFYWNDENGFLGSGTFANGIRFFNNEDTSDPNDSNLSSYGIAGEIIHYGGAGGVYSQGFDFKTHFAASGYGWGTGPTSKMRILGNGNIGIGTTVPSNKLELHGGALALVDPTNYINTTGNERGAEYVTNNLLFKHDTHPWHEDEYINTTAKISSIMEAVTLEEESGKTSLGFFTAAGWKNSMSLTEKMRITSTGNVGIGTNDPTSKLHVDGAVKIGGVGGNSDSIIFNTSGADKNTIQQYSWAYGNQKTENYVTVDNGGNGKHHIGYFVETNYSHPYAFPSMRWIINNNTTRPACVFNGGNTNGQTQSEIMYFKNNGNIGMGTTNPTSKLEVNGRIKAPKNQLQDGDNIGGVVPAGVIVMWSGSTVPNGWALCDGGNGTPNLVNRFIYGSRPEDAKATGGSNTKTLAVKNLPSHSHTINISDPGHDHSYTRYNDNKVVHWEFWRSSADKYPWYSDNFWFGNSSQNTGSRGTGITASSEATGSGNSFDIRPAFYTLAFIMKLP